jgi:hypothetical protein
MDRRVKIERVGVQDTMGGDQNLMGRRVKIPWVGESKYHG